MPFQRLRLLIAYDPEHGLCERVIPRMKELLLNRAFDVDVVTFGEGADLTPYRGLILGAPVRGLGLRGDQPSEAFQKFVAESDGLDEKRVALFSVYSFVPGRMLARMRELVEARGAQVVVSTAYHRFRPQEGEHVLPAECMVRIRGG